MSVHSLPAIAQNTATITGRVTDSTGLPLERVTVTTDISRNSSLTDAKGDFSIKVTGGDKNLLFSFVGMKPGSLSLTGQTSYSIKLVPEVTGLADVVVIGYGTVKKSDLTGAVISLKSEDLTAGANVNVQQMLQGRAAGVQVSQLSGEPGSAMNIKIRGVTSITAGNDPLYVIDGMPVNDGSPNSGTGAFFSDANPRNPLNSLNPSDIASVEILKDASATAIYGSRGANGVVIITTKTGLSDGLKINYNTYYGFQKVTRKEKNLTAQQYHGIINNIISEGGGLITDTVAADYGNGTDWQSHLYQEARTQSHDLSISGGSKNTKFFASLGFFDQDGILKNSGTTRYTARLNLENGVSKKYRIGVNINTSYIEDKYNSVGRGTNEDGSAIYAAINYDPTSPVFDASGAYYRSPFMNIDNPVALINGETGIGHSYRTFGTVYGEYFIIPALSVKVRLAGDVNSSRRNVWVDPITQSAKPYNGVASIITGTKTYYLGEATVNYNTSFGDHVLNALAGATYERFHTSTFSGNGRGYSLPDLTYNAIGTGNTTLNQLGSSYDENILTSFLGRVNYSFKNKYLLTASIRADGSARFGENNRFGYFPSAAIAWKISQEPFIKQARMIDELKFRVSYGATGNQAIGNYLYIPSFLGSNNVVFNSTIYTSIFPTRKANPDLKWEAASQLDLGIDFSLFKRRISGSIEYYIRKTTNLLIDLPLPASSGFTSQLQNIGSMRNTGIDIQLNFSVIKNKDFSWEFNPNISFYKNKVLSIGPLASIISGGQGLNGGMSIIQPGLPIQSYYGYQIDGTWQVHDDYSAIKDNVKPGDVKYRDVNGDSTLSDKDRVVLGSPLPDYTFGITNEFNYKNISLSIFIEGTQGASLLYSSMVDAYFPVSLRRNKLAEPYLNRWTPDNPTNEYPSFIRPVAQGQRQVNSKTVMDASFVRLQSVRLSYNIPLKNRKLIRSCMVYVTGQNLLLLTDYKGIDPSANAGAGAVQRIDFSSYPFTKTYTLGLNVEF